MYSRKYWRHFSGLSLVKCILLPLVRTTSSEDDRSDSWIITFSKELLSFALSNIYISKSCTPHVIRSDQKQWWIPTIQAQNMLNNLNVLNKIILLCRHEEQYKYNQTFHHSFYGRQRSHPWWPLQEDGRELVVVKRWSGGRRDCILAEVYGADIIVSYT